MRGTSALATRDAKRCDTSSGQIGPPSLTVKASRAHRQSSLVLLYAMRSEYRDTLRRQRYGTASLCGLRGLEVSLASDCNEALLNIEYRMLEIYVTPSHAEQFSSSHARHESDEPDGTQRIIRCHL
jgi:hypothetical protein